VAISPDGTLLAVGGDFVADPLGERDALPTELKVFEASTGKLLAVFGGHAQQMLKLCFTSKGQLVSLATDNVLRVWALADYRALLKCSFELAFRGDQVWNVERPSDKARVEVFHDQVIEASNFATSPDGTITAVATRTKEVFILETLSGKLSRRITCSKIARVDGVQYSPDGSLLAISGPSEKDDVEVSPRVFEPKDGHIEIWQVREGKLVATLGERESCLAISPDNRHLISPSNGGRVWEIGTGKVKYQIVSEFKGWDAELHSAVFLSDGKTFATLHPYSPVRFWELATGKEIDPTRLK